MLARTATSRRMLAGASTNFSDPILTLPLHSLTAAPWLHHLMPVTTCTTRPVRVARFTQPNLLPEKHAKTTPFSAYPMLVKPPLVSVTASTRLSARSPETTTLPVVTGSPTQRQVSAVETSKLVMGLAAHIGLMILAEQLTPAACTRPSIHQSRATTPPASKSATNPTTPHQPATCSATQTQRDMRLKNNLLRRGPSHSKNVPKWR